MELSELNPCVYYARRYEKINRKEECASYVPRLFYIVSGDVSFTVGKENIGHLGAGSLLLIGAGVPYKMKGQYLDMVAVAFSPVANELPYAAMPSSELDHSLLTDHGLSLFSGYKLLSDMESEREELCRMCDVFLTAEGFYLAELSARLKLILCRIAEAVDEHSLPSRMTVALGEYILENIGEEISNTEVAATFGYHPFYISNVLKSAKGQTLRQYIISYRLKLAKAMLIATSKSAAEIAEECGFTDASYFTKIFRQNFGRTPKDFRNEFKDEFI